MEKKDWLYTLILFLVMGLIQTGLSFTSKWLIQFEFFSPPTFLLPAVDPRLDNGFISDSFMGFTLKGQWWILFVYLSALIFNIVGEEFWWRGYILPKQEIFFKIGHGLYMVFFGRYFTFFGNGIY